MSKMYRQGDVLIVAVNEIPESQPVAREQDHVVLAHGEVTGHSHRIASRHATLMRTEADVRYMRVTAPVELRHEEHSPVKIPPGNYRVTIHAEYVPGALPRRVED